MNSQIDFTKGSFSYDLSDFVIVYFCLVIFIFDVGQNRFVNLCSWCITLSWLSIILQLFLLAWVELL